ncbi:MAG: GNAT family N-acetyltransferase [Bacilli bacterium]|nr:GNAT family N-acetyltransferase [Bacilli bacterium]MDD4643521.1 GNAT family N-acetyltransferase [Bacilli bacterium]
MSWKAHENIEITKEVLKEWVNSYVNKDYYQWGIVVKQTNELIGSIGIVGNIENRLICEMGYCIEKNYWGNGYVVEAFNRIIEFLFTETNCNRIEAVHDVDNVNSGKVIIKCNLEFEGVLRDRGLNNDLKLIDLAMYFLLKRDYLRK